MELQDFFTIFKKSDSAYQHYCQSVMQDWDVNATSFQIIMFLANNPQYNTARDLCRMRGIKTGIASVSIEQLIQRGYLERKTDSADRRIQRLFVTESAAGLVKRGREVQREFFSLVADCLTEKELETYLRLQEKIMTRVEQLEREL